MAGAGGGGESNITNKGRENRSEASHKGGGSTALSNPVNRISSSTPNYS